jgi:RND family efflux transporter MFP subunit
MVYFTNVIFRNFIMEKQKPDLSALKINREKKESLNSNKSKIYYFIGILAFLLLLILILFNPFSRVQEVKLATVVLQKPGVNSASLNASGYIVAQRKAAIASKGTGRLVSLGVVEGDHVKKNQIIARLENDDILAQLDEAKANLKLVEADIISLKNNYEREKELFEKKLSSEQNLELAEAGYKRILASAEIIKARIKQLEVALENTIIRSPFDGTILTKNAEVGEIVAPFGGGINSKTAVVTVADMNSLLVETDVSESNIEKIKPNQDCQIVLDAYPEKSYQGYVFKIVPTADRSKATVLVKVGFKDYDSRVLPEMSAKVTFFTEKIDPGILEQKPLLIIPEKSIVTEGNSSFVYRVIENKAKKTEIKIGEKLGSYVEVISGLNAGEKIINEISDKIKDGDEVKFVQ